MREAALLRTSVFGSMITALCCITPALVVPLVAVGLSAGIGWLDDRLLPALAVVVAITVYALWRRQQTA